MNMSTWDIGGWNSICLAKNVTGNQLAVCVFFPKPRNFFSSTHPLFFRAKLMQTKQLTNWLWPQSDDTNQAISEHQPIGMGYSRKNPNRGWGWEHGISKGITEIACRISRVNWEWSWISRADKENILQNFQGSWFLLLSNFQGWSFGLSGISRRGKVKKQKNQGEGGGFQKIIFSGIAQLPKV